MTHSQVPQKPTSTHTNAQHESIHSRMALVPTLVHVRGESNFNLC